MAQKNTIPCEEISDNMFQSIVSISNSGTLRPSFLWYEMLEYP